MSLFKNLPWSKRQRPKPDTKGGIDWYVLDSSGAIMAQVFHIVGDGDERDAEAVADSIVYMANKTAEISL